jgi:hypothetical protein
MTYRLTGTPAISFADIAQLFSEARGKKVPYTAVCDEEYTKIKLAEGWRAFVVEFARGWVDGMNEGEWAEETRDYEQLVAMSPKRRLTSSAMTSSLRSTSCCRWRYPHEDRIYRCRHGRSNHRPTCAAAWPQGVAQ